jgi:hypothetical protein
MLVGVFVVCLAVSASADTWYVATNSLTDGPGTSWSNAFWTIQGAVNAAGSGDTVLVTNGTYCPSSQISVSKLITVESVNGPDVTIVDGQNVRRGFSLGNTACTIGGFTITRGNAGDTVGWPNPAPPDKAFYRVHGAE